MDEQNPTTVRLTEKAQKVKKEFKDVYGLKNILSAGLVLFGKLTSQEKEAIINEAKSSLESEVLQNPEEEFRKRVRQVLKELEVLPAESKHKKKAKTPKSA